MSVKKLSENGITYPDIREREWSKIDSPASKLLQLLIDAENIFIELDEYQMDNNNLILK